VAQLWQRYAEAFVEGTGTANRAWLLDRIAWCLQAKAEGGLSERARARAPELADHADLRSGPPQSRSAAVLEVPAKPAQPQYSRSDELWGARRRVKTDLPNRPYIYHTARQHEGPCEANRGFSAQSIGPERVCYFPHEAGRMWIIFDNAGRGLRHRIAVPLCPSTRYGTTRAFTPDEDDPLPVGRPNGRQGSGTEKIR
jgi:hypothetical protein